MGVDKNLFLHDLAVVSIMKNEGHYVKEWLDYHLLAGVDHFFIYDNGSPDNQSEVIQPYIDAGLVTYIDYPGKARQYEAYNAAARDYKFFCRYMAFIDGDEFIFPKIADNIVEAVDEILADKPNAGALAVNIFGFGSNYQDKADLTKGILERFTRRQPIDDTDIMKESGLHGGCAHVSSITNPRRIDFFFNPHFAMYFKPYYAVNENGGRVEFFSNYPPTVAKIVMHHYSSKSREEYENKVRRGTADAYYNVYKLANYTHDTKSNEVFDDSILKYRDKIFAAFKSKYGESADIINTFAEVKRVNYEKILQTLSSTLLAGFKADNLKNYFADVQNCTQYFGTLERFLNIAPPNFYQGKVETFLTCLALSSYLKKNFLDEESGNLFEDFSIRVICRSLAFGFSIADWKLLAKELPNILAMPHPAVNMLRNACLEIIPQLQNSCRVYDPMAWREFVDLDDLLRMLKVFDSYNHK